MVFMQNGQAPPKVTADAFSQFMSSMDNNYSDTVKSAILALITKLKSSNCSLSTVKETDNLTVIRVTGDCSLMSIKTFILSRINPMDSVYTSGVICYAEKEQAITFISGTKGHPHVTSRFKVKFVLTGKNTRAHVDCMLQGVYNKGSLQKYEHNINVPVLETITKKLTTSTGISSVVDYIKYLNYSNAIDVLKFKQTDSKSITLKLKGVNWETIKSLHTLLSYYVDYLQLVKHESAELEFSNFGNFARFHILKVSKDMKLYTVCTILVDIKCT